MFPGGEKTAASSGTVSTPKPKRGLDATTAVPEPKPTAAPAKSKVTALQGGRRSGLSTPLPQSSVHDDIGSDTGQL